MEQIAEEVHKPIRKQKEYRKVIVYYVNDIWSADIVEMNSDGMAEQNDGYKYILVVIDIFSRYAWTRKMKSKTGKETADNFKSIINEAGEKPNAVWVDQGKEFFNKDVQKILNGVKLYSTYGEGKAAYVERLNRTLKNMMYKQFTVKQNRKWIGMLDEITQKYNNTTHTATGKKPAKLYADNPKLPVDVEETPKSEPKFKIGDRVRISYKRRPVFDKAYLPNWTWEIFEVSKVKKTNPWTYKIKDEEGEEIEGSFYESELQKTKQKKGVHLVEKELEEKTINGKKMVLVKWLGYKKPTWELASKIPKQGFEIAKTSTQKKTREVEQKQPKPESLMKGLNKKARFSHYDIDPSHIVEGKRRK